METFVFTKFVALAVAGAAAFTDARTGHIPNRLSLWPLALAPLYFLWMSGWQAALASIASALVAAFVPYLLFRKGACGGGDVKLVACFGALCGASLAMEVQLCAFVLAAMFALCRLTFKGQLLTTLLRALHLLVASVVPGLKTPPTSTMSTIRLGPFFLLGFFVCLFPHDWWL